MYNKLGVPRCFMFEVYGTTRFFPLSGAFRSEIGKPPRGLLASLGSRLPNQPAAPLAETATHPYGLRQVNSTDAANKQEDYDCIGYFNPTTLADYEQTVNAWADALLVVINQSTVAL